MKTLLIGEIHPEAENLLTEKVELQKITNQEFEQTSSFPEIKVVVLRTFTKLGEEELNKFPNLSKVVSCSVGLDNLNLEKLNEKEIELIHCPGSNANSVAEHTLHFIYSLLRREKPFAELKHKTVGIVGLGYIGKLVAKKLLGSQAQVIAFDVIEPDPNLLKELNVEMKSFDEVVQADILTVHVPLNKHTENLINEETFARMKPNVFFINTSRAEVINEEALLKSIEAGKFRGVALDTFSDELQEKLKENEKVIFTNHVAAQGEDSFKQMCKKPIEEFLRRT